MSRGEYGTPPGEIDPSIVKKVLGDDLASQIAMPASLAPEFDNFQIPDRRVCKNLMRMFLSYALFPGCCRKVPEGARPKRKENRAKYTIVEA